MSGTDVVVSAWRELMAAHAAVSCALERELSEKHGLGVSEFEVLDRMVEGLATGDVAGTCSTPGTNGTNGTDGADGADGADGKAMFRVQELVHQVHLSQSALSRLIARLEREGLVTRTMCEADRRGVYVRLTEEGRKRHAEAAPTHRAVLTSRLPVTDHSGLGSGA